LTTPARPRALSPLIVVVLIVSILLTVVALSAAIVGGDKVRCPSATDSSPSRPLAQACFPAAATP
jgi:hypothetical protein